MPAAGQTLRSRADSHMETPGEAAPGLENLDCHSQIPGGSVQTTLLKGPRIIVDFPAGAHPGPPSLDLRKIPSGFQRGEGTGTVVKHARAL